MEYTKLDWFIFGLVLGYFSFPIRVVLSKIWREADKATKGDKTNGKPN